ncbi:MAG: hypothetical protein IKZ87_04625 [Actinomycetaceae bacterium]|nr:hypothetical protein [Actinomycetaceae bacterium]
MAAGNFAIPLVWRLGLVAFCCWLSYNNAISNKTGEPLWVSITSPATWTKKQKFQFDGAKLMEFSWIGNQSMQAFAALMDGAWKGDTVYVVGDYAELDEDCELTGDDAWLPQLEATLRDLQSGSPPNSKTGGATLKSKAEARDFSRGSLHDVTEAAMQRVADGEQLRYILNSELGVYVDLAHCPADDIIYYAEEDRADDWRVHPLSLLLAMGNGRGGGDFYGSFAPFVDLHADRRAIQRSTNSTLGAWTETVASIRFAKGGEESLLDGLQEWRPDFSESIKPTAWQDIPAKIAEVLAEGRAKHQQAA